jgi:phosphoribosylformylglycinamidine synthase subunit PurQ / glutaminase
MTPPRVLILRAPGSNCDGELHFAFEKAGGAPEKVHINRLRENPKLLKQFQILAIPGGFTYGDDVAAGKILATQLSHFLGEAIRQFRDAEKLIIGVCNGFQALLKSGVLLPPDPDEGPLATLANNDPPGFKDRWIRLAATPESKCPWLKGIDQMLVPIAHGEGRFVCRHEWILKGLEQSGQVVLRYCDERGEPGSFPINPNGSQGHVGGICDPTGRVLGLMPHPERHVLPTQHPHWTRNGLKEEGDGLKLFLNAVRFFA